MSVEVIDPRTLVPLDTETIADSVAKTGRVVVVHEAVQFFGFGSEIAAHIAEHSFWDLDAPVAPRRRSVASDSVPAGSRAGDAPGARGDRRRGTVAGGR